MPNAIDVLTAAEGRAAVDVGDSDATRNLLLDRAITAVSRRLDRAFGPIVKRTVTNERHDGGNCGVWLRYYPVKAITTVTEHSGGIPAVLPVETPTNLADGYLPSPYDVDPSLYNGELVRRSGGCVRPFASGAVLVTYEAGRYDTTAAVDPIYKLAAEITLKNYWRTTEQSTTPVGEFEAPAQTVPALMLPKAVRDLLADELQERPGVA